MSKALNENEIIDNGRLYEFKVPTLNESDFSSDEEYASYVCMICDLNQKPNACKSSKCTYLERKDKQHGYYSLVGKIK